MSNLIPGNQKHLTLKDRLFIEESLERNLSFKEIARYLCKDPTTISKEVKAHRKHVPHSRASIGVRVRTNAPTILANVCQVTFHSFQSSQWAHFSKPCFCRL